MRSALFMMLLRTQAARKTSVSRVTFRLLEKVSNSDATVLIREKGKDRAQQAHYIYRPNPFTMVPASVPHIENLSRGISSGTITLSLTVASVDPVTISDVRLAGGDRNFRIVGMTPPVQSGAPVTLENGEKLQLGVAGLPSVDEGEITDTVLIETGFLTNRADEARLGDPRQRQAVASAIADAVEAYFQTPQLYAGA